MKLVVDVDGVLADQVSPVLARLNSEYGLNVTRDQIRTWNEPIADTDIKTAIESAQLDADFILAMKPIEGAREAMLELANEHEITVATDRGPLAEDATVVWLKNNGIPYNRYVGTSQLGKGAIAGDILIDDYPRNVLRFIENGGLAILFDQPWNENDPSVEEAILQGRVIRARGWRCVLCIVRSLEPSTTSQTLGTRLASAQNLVSEGARSAESRQ